MEHRSQACRSIWDFTALPVDGGQGDQDGLGAKDLLL